MSSRIQAGSRRFAVRVVSTVIVVLALAVFSGHFVKWLSTPTVLANNTAQTLPFAQDWTNTGLITTNDNWSGAGY